MKTNILQKVINLAFLTLFLLSFTKAAYLENVPIELKQPDGKIINVFATGDEYYNWVHDKDNYTILQNEITGYYVYAQVVNGKLVPTEYIVGRVNPVSVNLVKGANVVPEETKQKFLARNTKLLKSTPLHQLQSSSTFYNIVILIRFSDEPEFHESDISTGVKDNPQRYESTFNTGNPSVKGFYNKASYGKLNVVSKIFPQPVGNTLPSYKDDQPRNYYRPYNASTNPIGYQSNQKYSRLDALLKKALNWVKQYIPANEPLDGNNDGRIDNLSFIVFGNPDSWNDLLWPHFTGVHGVTINGKSSGNYNLNLQRRFEWGVLCHELGHSLGLPDYYRYWDKTITPVGTWSMMSSNRSDFTMREKYHLGWINNVPEITTNGTYTVNLNTNANNNTFKIKSPLDSTNHIMVEFRKQASPYEGTPGTGLVIYRIYEPRWGSVHPPDEIYIYRPGGSLTVNGDWQQAHFSSNVGRTFFNDFTSNAKAFLHDGNKFGVSISNIGSSAGNEITFDVTIMDKGEIKTSNRWNIVSVPVKNNHMLADSLFKSKTSPVYSFSNSTGYVNETTLENGRSYLVKYNSNSTINLLGEKVFATELNITAGWNLVGIFSKEVDLTKITTSPAGLIQSHFFSYENTGYTPEQSNLKPSIGYWVKSSGAGKINISNALMKGQNKTQTKKENLSKIRLTDRVGVVREILYINEEISDISKWEMPPMIPEEADIRWIGNKYLVNLENPNELKITNMEYPIKIEIEGSPVQIIENSLGKSKRTNITQEQSYILQDSTITSLVIKAEKSNQEESIVYEYELNQNYPNPFNPSTNITYTLPVESIVKVRVYDILGREIKTLENQIKNPGKHTLTFNANGLSSGIYVYRIEAISTKDSKSFVETKKMVYLK